ncbi:hypothetical protein GMD78_12625 [Ornithinibacillus sp. L9]|uniref:Uncharacterized protein n=1 Tax=Ornithinibacillus caprae TaxID=2678566 RepID=A0A6N8FMI2_9BACI|nr:hypothetical protein [Ornithinibacillus caprae]MUK89217.1 hypothetical protein [Ornithinibacillus caprae]
MGVFIIVSINEQLVKTKGDIRKKQKFERQLADYESELHEIESAIQNLSHQLEKEQKDVKKLEGISITNLVSTIVGNKYEKLDKEEQEVAAVQLKLEEAKKTKNEITNSINDVRYQLERVNNSENEYKNLLVQKEELIKDTNSVYSEKLYQLDDQQANLQSHVTELKEAIAAGNTVKKALNHALDSLQSAKGWGTWDMVGGGMISSAVKHSHIDTATNHIHIAQSRMRKFQKELLDVNEVAHMQIDMSGLLKFADFFFDGLIVDWMVQGRINDSLQQTREHLTTVNQIVSNLESQLSKTELELNQNKQDRDSLIESL